LVEPIKKDDQIRKILARQEFAGFSQFILPVPARPLTPFLKTRKLSFFKMLSKSWNVDDMVDGLNRMVDLADQDTRIHYDIWSEADKAQDARKVRTALFHFPAPNKGPFALVCAGGAYMLVASLIEAFPVAAELNRMGYSAFVLHYRTGKKNPWPAAMEDLQQALHFILERVEELNVERENYAVAGFSAGGHLAASLGTDIFSYREWDLPKPGALILAYPVTMYEHMTKVHQQCRDILIGKNPSREQMDSIHIVAHTEGDSPPTYLWHCRDDSTVYFENSQALADKLYELGIPCQFKAVPGDGHGIALGNGTPAQGWLAEAVKLWHKNDNFTRSSDKFQE